MFGLTNLKSAVWAANSAFPVLLIGAWFSVSSIALLEDLHHVVKKNFVCESHVVGNSSSGVVFSDR
jgi:hypothetical protein